jgi:hypothetical protein
VLTLHLPGTNGLIGTIGLALDIIGAFYLARHFLKRNPEAFVEESRTLYGSNPFVLRSAAQQAVDAWVGFFHLLAGFLAQALAYSGWFQTGPDRYFLFILAATIAYFCISFPLYQRACIRSSRRRLARTFKETITRSFSEDRGDQARLVTARFYARVLDLHEDESMAAEDLEKTIREKVEEWAR